MKKNVLGDQEKFKLWTALKEMERELQEKRPPFVDLARRLTQQLQFRITEHNISNAVENEVVVYKPLIPKRVIQPTKLKEGIDHLGFQIDTLTETTEERFSSLEEKLALLDEKLSRLEKDGNAISTIVFNVCQGLGLTAEGKDIPAKTEVTEKQETPPPEKKAPPPEKVEAPLPEKIETPPEATKSVEVPKLVEKPPEIVPMETTFSKEASPVLAPRTPPEWDWAAYRQLEKKFGGNSRVLLRALQKPIKPEQEGTVPHELMWRSAHYAVSVTVCRHEDRWCWSVAVRHVASKDIQRKMNDRKSARYVMEKSERMAYRYLANAGFGACSKILPPGCIVLYKKLSEDEITFLGRNPPSGR